MRFASTTVSWYEQIVNLFGYPLNHTDIDQIKVFRTWYTNMLQMQGHLTNKDVIGELTSETWDNFCRFYLIYVQNQQS